MRDLPSRPGWMGLILALALLAPSARGAQTWSPDGGWLAYVVANRPSSDRIGWLLGQEADEPLGPTRYRLWATRVATEESVLLFESSGPLASPAWSPDGKALAFAHVSEGPDQTRRFDLVLQEAPDRRRVVRGWALDGAGDSAWRPELTEIGWSADGKYLAVSGLPEIGIAVLEASDGQVVHEFPGGSRPAWAPEGNLLALVGAGEPPGLDLYTVADDQVRRLAEIPGLDRLPAPVWSNPGDALYVLAYRAEGDPNAQASPAARRPTALVPDLSGEPGQVKLRLDRIGRERGDREPVQLLQHEPFGSLDDLQAVAFGIDRQETDIFYSVTVRGSRSVLTWVGLPNHDTIKHFNPLQWNDPIAALAISPNPTRLSLAVWFEPDGRLSPPLLSDPRNEVEPRLLAPDDDARAAWLEILLDAIGHELELALATPMAGPVPEQGPRPTRLPAPGDLEDNNPSLGRLRRLAATGREICARLGTSSADLDDRTALVDTARVVFAYFPKPTGDPAADHAPALAALDRLERHGGSVDQRSRLLGLRAQIAMVRRRYARAEAILGPLREANARGGQRIEETARGPVLEPSAPSAGWPRSLADRLVELREGRPSMVPVAIDEVAPPNHPSGPIIEEPLIQPPAIPLPEPPPDPGIRIVPRVVPSPRP